MRTPREVLENCKQDCKPEWKIAFFSVIFIGLLIHLPAMVWDIPNHDGLSSIYFDQNMITSGRWFLTVACGISSYFTLPWMIGLLSLFYLACTAVVLTELLDLQDKLKILLVSGLLVAFPASASTFAYVFTMDGYMLALLLAVLSVLLVAKNKYGFLWGGISLAFSMGIYQAYLPFAIILCIYQIAMLMTKEGGLKEKLKASLNYLYMGGIGLILYYVILQILLRVQGKVLADYQGINGMGEATSGMGFLQNVMTMWKDFFVFSLKGNVFFNNVFSGIALLLLALCFGATLILALYRRKWWKKLGFFVIIGLLIVGLPIGTNIILFVSPNVNHHLLMRYQWVLYPILMIAFCECFGEEWKLLAREWGDIEKLSACVEWMILGAAFVLLFNYAVTDHIGYSNLQKRYEKTYAYCVRLLDRMEQTDGYYQGIPIAIVGIVGYTEFPDTDITEKVTGGMIGVSGDTLLYTAENYQAFMKNYLGATLNFLDVETVGEIYFSEEYVAMNTFPAENSVKVVDGIMYVKTENVGRN